MANACPSIRLRLATEVFPGLLGSAEVEALRLDIETQPLVKQIVRKQKDTGVWGGNLLGVAASKAAGVKDVGTIPQFRRLVELGVSREARAQRLAARVLFRLVSRDEDVKLLFEFARYSTTEIGAESWIRGVLREAASAALAAGGHGDDPRVRGAAHKILNEVSAFVRSEAVEDPFVRSGGAWILRPDAHPPTVFSLSLLASLPAVQRERAGLVERLGVYLGKAAPKKTYSVSLGKKAFKPNFLLLGDPVHVGASGQPDDLPLALWWMETLARLGLLATSTTAAKVWARLAKDCDERGVWSPKNLRTLPRSSSPWAYAMFPLEGEARTPEARHTDVTFRMALIARLAGWELVGD